MLRCTFLVALACAAAFTAGGCGSDEPSGDQATPVPTPTEAAPATLPDACRLLSEQQVADRLGGAAESEADKGEVFGSDDSLYTRCTWSVRERGYVSGKLTLVLIGGTQRYETLAEDPDAQPAEGAGDAAVAFTGGSRFDLADEDDLGPDGIDTKRTIAVRAGGRTILIEWNLIAVRNRADLERRLPNGKLAAVARDVIAALGGA